MISLAEFAHSLSPQEREEIAQEARFRAWTRGGRTKRYTAKCARWLALSLLRRQASHRRWLDGTRYSRDPRASWRPVDRVEASIDARRALTVLERAPESYRTTLTLLYLEGASVRDVAQECGISEELVYKRHSRGLSWLRRRLEAA